MCDSLQVALPTYRFAWPFYLISLIDVPFPNWNLFPEFFLNPPPSSVPLYRTNIWTAEQFKIIDRIVVIGPAVAHVINMLLFMSWWNL
jgi:hypothetical protein